MADDRVVKYLVPCALTLVNFIYGAWQLVAKAAMEDGASPFVFVLYRSLGGATVMFLALSFMPGLRGDKSQQPSTVAEILPCLKSDGSRLFVLGFLQTINIGGGILAISQLPAITCAIFQPTVPVVAACMSLFLGMEKFTIQTICSIILSVVGAIIVITYRDGVSASGSIGSFNMVGLFFLCCNVGGGAMYAVYQKNSGVLDDYSPTFVAGMSFVIASCLFVVPAISTTGLDGVAWRLGGHSLSLLALCYAVVLTTAFNYSVMAWANKETTPTMVTSFVTLQPMVTALLSLVFLGVLLTAGQLIGGAAILAGLLLNVHSQNADSDAMPLKLQSGGNKV